jgi:hypothetical protein
MQDSPAPWAARVRRLAAAVNWREVRVVAIIAACALAWRALSAALAFLSGLIAESTGHFDEAEYNRQLGK